MWRLCGEVRRKVEERSVEISSNGVSACVCFGVLISVCMLCSCLLLNYCYQFLGQFSSTVPRPRATIVIVKDVAGTMLTTRAARGKRQRHF